MSLLDPNDPKDQRLMIRLCNSGFRVAPGAHPGPVHAVREGEDLTLCKRSLDYYHRRGTMEKPEQVTCTNCYEILIEEIGR